MVELPHHFKGFVLKKIKTGRKVTHLKFTWEIEKQTVIEKEKIEIQITESLNSIFEKEEKISKEVRESEESENPLLLAYSKMPKAIQDMLLDQAKGLYMKDVNIQKMNATHEKFFKAAQKSYILKVLGV